MQMALALILDFRQGLPGTLPYAGLQDYPRAILLRIPTPYGLRNKSFTWRFRTEAEDQPHIHLDNFERGPTYVLKSKEANRPGGKLINWPASRPAR